MQNYTTFNEAGYSELFSIDVNILWCLPQMTGGYANGAKLINTFIYSTFKVGPASSFYQLTVGGFSTPPGQVDRRYVELKSRDTFTQSWATLPRQHDHMLSRQKIQLISALCLYKMWLLHLITKALTFIVFFVSLEIYYFVALSLWQI